MEILKVEMTGPKELVELGNGLSAFLKVLKEVSKDGFDASDISPVLVWAMGDLVPALEGVDQIAEEFLADREVFVGGVAIVATSIVGALLN